jgi:PAS domain S-box-containing protein
MSERTVTWGSATAWDVALRTAGCVVEPPVTDSGGPAVWVCSAEEDLPVRAAEAEIYLVAVAPTEAAAERARRAGADEVVPAWSASVVEAVRRGHGLLRQRTAMRETEAQIESMARAAQHREAFFAMSLDMLCIADIDGYFRQLNPAWSRLGWSFEELCGRPFLEFVHPDDVAATLEVMGKLTTSDYSTVEFENRYRCRDGTYRWLLWTSRTSYDAAHPDDRLYYAVAHDITERKAREEQLRLQSEKLARSNADLEQFAHIASHDLQEPLRMVTSYVRLLEKRYKGHLDAQADKYIHYAVDGALRMHALINDLLAYSRVNSEGLELVPVDSGTVLARALDDLRVVIEDSGARLAIGELPVVLADAGQIRQVFQNLVGNAVKFTARGEAPQVGIAAVPEPGAPETVRFTVADRGIGIEPHHFQRIFEIFQRLHGRGEYPGTGIGLAVCQKIVQRHGGRIWVESEVGRGTAFHFTLQRAGP